MPSELLAGAVVGAALGFLLFFAVVIPGVVRSVRYDWRHRNSVPEWARNGWLWWLS